MSSREPFSFAPALVLALVSAASLASAHGEATGAYDPLSLEWHAFLSAEGAIVGAPPAAGSVALPPAPVPPLSNGPPLRFAFDAPVAFEPGGGFRVSLVLRVDKPLVAQGEALELTVEPGGEPVRVPLPGGPALAPGSIVTAEALVHAPGVLYEKGAKVELLVQPLVAALPEDALSLIVGGEQASRVDALDMRVPSPADLRLQDVTHTEIILGADVFAPPADHAVNTFVVGHAAVVPPASGAWSAAGTYVVLRGEEDDADARGHALVDEDARRAAAHAFRVNGVPARVHPGLGVIVRVTSMPIRVVCEQNCPAEGFTWSYAPTSATPADTPSVLVPPPRDTSGIPVSEDEPEDKATPFPAALMLPLALFAALAWRRR